MSFFAKHLQIRRNTTPKHVDFGDLGFGKYFSPHMLEINWTKQNGWEYPSIVPYAPLLIEPSCSSLHYAISCFEGMKAYKNQHDKIFLFRPEYNTNRFLDSIERLSLPTFNSKEFVSCLKELIRVDKEYIPQQHHSSLYIRPFLFSTDPTLAVVSASSAKLLVITSPVSSYFSSTKEGITLKVDPVNKRACRGGTGNYKISSNYAPTIMPRLQAQKEKCDDILWLGDANEITEAGTMNIMCLWYNKEGKKELITPPLTEGVILPGITRDSILQLCRQKEDLIVSEKIFTVTDIIEAVKEDRMIEMFGSGTAAVVTQINKICVDNTNYVVSKNSEFSKNIYKELTNIQYGLTKHFWSIEL